MASKRRFYGRDKARLKHNKAGMPLCRYCEKIVESPRRTFCSNECVHQWKLRKSSSYVRSFLFKRDRGVCVMCGMDTHTLRMQGKKMKLEAYKAFAKSLKMPYKRSSWWDADHIVPVVEGGGECGLENYRTLCILCHRKVTRELAARLAKKRKFENAEKERRKPIQLPPSETDDPKLYYLWKTGKLKH